MNILENQKFIIGALGLLLGASLVGNAYLYQKLESSSDFSFTNGTSTSSVTTFQGPGFRNEVVTFFDGQQYRTYSTSTPLTDSDVRAMREEMEKEFDRMNEFFRKQDELFRSLWDF